MGQLACGGAVTKCSFGVAPSVLMVLPENRVLNELPVATIMDHVPLVNILPFGLCQSMANPEVAAATAAAMGALTPMPCIPFVEAPWIPGAPTVLIGEFPALDNESTLLCNWGGLIEIEFPGQETIITEE